MVRRILKYLKRAAIAVAAFLLLYVLIVLIGFIPVNNSFRASSDGVTIYVISSDVHADFLLPVNHERINWREAFPEELFEGNTRGARHVAIGWGDQGFYLETPTWADLKVSTAVRAMFWPSATCLHVAMTDASGYKDARQVVISDAQYVSLVDFIESSFERDEDGDRKLIAGKGYGKYDTFFEAEGSYNCFNTCNVWVGRGLKQAGMRAPLFAPLPRTVLMYLPE